MVNYMKGVVLMMVSGVRSRTQGMVLCALFAAMTAVLSQVAIPLPLVPINMALLAVYLAGGVLGARLCVESGRVCVLRRSGSAGVFFFSRRHWHHLGTDGRLYCRLHCGGGCGRFLGGTLWRGFLAAGAGHSVGTGLMLCVGIGLVYGGDAQYAERSAGSMCAAFSAGRCGEDRLGGGVDPKDPRGSAVVSKK